MAKKPGLGERACPKCKETIKVDAVICKHCRTEFSDDEVAAAKKESSSDTKAAAIGCLVLTLALGFCSYVVSDDAEEVADKPQISAKADAIAFYKGMMAAMSECDSASKRVSDAAKSNDVIALFQAANTMELKCLGAPSDIRAVKVPTSVGKEAYGKLSETRDVCENTYLAKWSAAGKMKEALDKGGLANVAALKQDMEMAQAGTIGCAAGLIGQVTGLGAKSSDLET
jgi:hypothetical protein